MSYLRGRMRHLLVWAFVWLVLGAGCGEDTSVEETDTPRTIPTIDRSAYQEQPPAEEERAEIDLAAEKQAIQELVVAYDEAVTRRNLDDTMALWVDKGAEDVFMVQEIAGVVWNFEGWKQVRDSWEGTWALVGGAKHTSTIERIGIDARAENATAKGTFQWGSWKGTLMIAFQKTKEGWKIRAIEYRKHGRIEEIEDEQG